MEGVLVVCGNDRDVRTKSDFRLSTFDSVS